MNLIVFAGEAEILYLPPIVLIICVLFFVFIIYHFFSNKKKGAGCQFLRGQNETRVALIEEEVRQESGGEDSSAYTLHSCCP